MSSLSLTAQGLLQKLYHYHRQGMATIPGIVLERVEGFDELLDEGIVEPTKAKPDSPTEYRFTEHYMNILLAEQPKDG